MSGESGGSGRSAGGEIGRPRLLDRVHESTRRRYYSWRTEEPYIHWIKRFIIFSGKRHPDVLGGTEVTAFLNHLAIERGVAASTQNQALSGLLFLYREVLQLDLPWLDGVAHVKRSTHVPVVLTENEICALLNLSVLKYCVANYRTNAGYAIHNVGDCECYSPTVAPNHPGAYGAGPPPAFGRPLLRFAQEGSSHVVTHAASTSSAALPDRPCGRRWSS